MTIIVVSCTKDPVLLSSPSPVSPPVFNPFTNRDYYWALSWDTAANGYKIIITDPSLTQDAINKGIDIYLAPWTEMSVFEKLPFDYIDPALSDTLRFSYTIIPGQLKIISNTRLNNRWDQSDVYILFK